MSLLDKWFKRSAPVADNATRQPAGDGLENVIAGLGTSRDKRYYTNYTMPTFFSEQELASIFRSSWLARRIVTTIPEDMVRNWRTIQFDETQMEQQKAFIALEKKLKLQDMVYQALCWGRLYGGGIIIISIDGQNLSAPLRPESIRKDARIVLRALDRHQVHPSSYLTQDIMSENFGMPDYYTLNVSGAQIHHTRVVRFDGVLTPLETLKQNNYWDDGVIQSIYDTLRDTDTINSAIATMIFEANVDVIKAPGMIDMLATKEGEARITKRFQLAALMKSFNRTLLLDGNESYEKKSNSFASLDAIQDRATTLVAGAAEMPVTKLFGTSAKGMNATGEGDLQNYYDTVSSKQETNLRPQLEYLDQILLRVATGTFPEDYDMEFNSLWQLDDVQQATVEKTRAERDQIYYNMGIASPIVIAQQLKSDGTYKHLTDEEISALEFLIPTEPTEPVAQENEEGETAENEEGETAENEEAPSNEQPVEQEPPAEGEAPAQTEEEEQ